MLSVDPKRVETKPDPELLGTMPGDQKIVHATAWPYQWTRKIGFGGVSWRAYGGLDQAGRNLLQKEKFEAAYFSSTVFSSFCLGPIWKARFGVPYFVDYHDPWWTDYYFRRGAPKPPGGTMKYRATQWMARKNEGRVIRGSAGVTCVSGSYVEMLRKRYPDVPPEKLTELPFGAPEKDYEILQRETRIQSSTEQISYGGGETWRYIGAGGPIMAASASIFGALLKEAAARHLYDPDQVFLEIAGTSYATYGKPAASLLPVILQEFHALRGTESPERLGYLENLKRLISSDRLILFGTDEPGYTASKLFNYILAKKPLLVICREESSVARIVRETRSADLITFGDEDVRLGGRIRIRSEWREAMGRWLAMNPSKEPATDWKAFEPYTARKMTEKLCRFFDERLEAEKTGKMGDGRSEMGSKPAGGGKWKVEGKQNTAKPKVLLVHPGIQHAPRLAEALEREGMLARFWTGWARSAESPNQLGKRRVGIPAEKLKTVPWLEWMALFLSKTGIDPEWVWHWRNRIFQNLIPDKEIADADVVIGFDTGSWLLAQKAKEMGKKFILDQSIGHPAARIPEMKKMGRAEETWDEPYQPRPGRLEYWERAEHNLANRIVAGSRFTQNTLIGQGVPESKIRILPYGVGEEFVAAGKRRARDGKEGKIRFLFLGQLAQRKGVQFLLEAWKGLPDAKAELVLMGGGSRRGWRRVAGEGVIFRGQVGRKKVLEEMGRSDVLVLPSLFEGFGLVILEAMAAGLAVITTTNTGGPDVIEDGKEGFIVPAGKANVLREKMDYFIQNLGEPIRMGQSAHQKAKHYTWEKYGGLYAKIVEEVVSF